MPQTSGRKSRVMINGIILRATRWQVQIRTTVEDDTTVCEAAHTPPANLPQGISGGVITVGAALSRFDVTFDALWDPTDNPFCGQPGIVPGATITQVKLWIHTINADADWEFHAGVITGAEMSSGVRELVRYNVSMTCWAVTRFPSRGVGYFSSSL